MRRSVALALWSSAVGLALVGLVLAAFAARRTALASASTKAADSGIEIFQAEVAQLEEWASECGEIGDAADASPGSRAWQRVRDVIASVESGHAVRIAIYGEDPVSDEADLRLLGYGEQGNVVRRVPGDWPGRVPATVTRLYRDWFIEDEEGEPHCWFSRQGEGPIRLNILIGVFAYPPADEDAESEALLIHASMRWRPGARHVETVRLDVVDGALATSLPTAELRGADAGGDSRIDGGAVLPREWSMRFPVQSDDARLTWSIAKPAPDWLPYLLGLLALGLAVAAVVRGVPRRESSSGPPDITAEAAHEMRTPLTAMRGEIEVALRRERTPEEYRSTLEACLSEAKGLQGILNNVLLLTRGAFSSPAREPVDLAAVVEAEVERVRRANPDRSVEIDRPAGPATVQGDPSLLARACGNLLDNAASYSIAGGAIRASVALEGAKVLVTVEDDGPGIPVSRHGQIFQRFYRGPEVGQRRIPGSGLGLPICRWIAELHGGTIDLDTSLKASTRFLLRVPVRAPRR